MEKDKIVYLAICFKLALDEHNRIDHMREVGGYIPYDEEERYILDKLRNQQINKKRSCFAKSLENNG